MMFLNNSLRPPNVKTPVQISTKSLGLLRRGGLLDRKALAEMLYAIGQGKDAMSTEWSDAIFKELAAKPESGGV